MSYAIVFPGQGSQAVGMCRSLCDTSDAAREVFREADDALGMSLSSIIFDGPEDELTKTANAQPAILTASIAAYRAYVERRGSAPTPAFFAGHSLGEYTALVAAGSLALADAVRLVRERGRLMQEAVPLGEGGMAAILGMDDDAVRALCDEASQGDVLSPANINSPGQVVVSGTAAAVERACAMAPYRGARRSMPLNVSAPFHCALMRPVADALRDEFDRLSWSAPSAPIMANAYARPVETVDDIKRALYEQTYSPVLWSAGVEAMSDAGVEAFVEFGPGNVLTGLVKRIVKGKAAAAVGDANAFAKADEIIGG